MPEVWKKIDWIDDLNGEYEVSSMGRVRRLGQIHYTFQGKKYINKVLYLKPSLATTGYYTVNLYPNGKLKHFYVHRLVATAFIQNNNPENDFINHMNEIKTDNRVENLEWCTCAYNIRYSHKKIHKPQKNFRKNEYGRNITKSKKDGKYEVKCYHNGKGKHIGRFSDVKEARQARNKYLDSLGLLDYLTDNEKNLLE